MSPLRRRGFRRLWTAGLVSDTGDWLLLVGLPIVVYQYTHSALGTACTFLLELAPPVLLAPAAGMIADRLPRRTTLIVVSVGQAGVLAPLLIVHGRGQLLVVYAVACAQAALAAVFDPTEHALLPDLVEAGDLVSANSLVALAQNVGRLVGGSLGGLLLAAGGGLSLIALGDGASFLAAAALIAGSGAAGPRVARPAPAAQPAAPPAARRLLVGFGPLVRAALEMPAVRAGLLVLLVASVAQGIFVVLYIVFVATVLHGPASEIGLLRGVQAIGAIAGGLVLAFARSDSPAVLTAVSALLFGLVDLAIWNAPHLGGAEPLYIGLFIAAGVPGTGFAAGLASVLQRAAPQARRGSVFAAAGVAESVGQAAGMMLAGLLAGPIGLAAVLNGQGVLYLLAGALAAVTLGRRSTSRTRGREREWAGLPGAPTAPGR